MKKLITLIAMVVLVAIAALASMGAFDKTSIPTDRLVTFDQSRNGALDDKYEGIQLTANSRRAASVNDYGLILSPDEGEIRFYNCSGDTYSPNQEEQSSESLGGTTAVVYCEDGTVYMNRIVPNYYTAYWIKGYAVDTALVFPVAQPIAYNSNYKCTLSVYWGEKESSTKIEEQSAIIFKKVDDNLVMQKPSGELFLGVFWDDDNSWTRCAVDAMTLTFDTEYKSPSMDLVVLPEGAEVQEWYALGDGSQVTNNVKIAFVDNEVYVSNLTKEFPESWIKGTIEGNTVTFPIYQYVGDAYGYNIWAIGFDWNSYVLPKITMTYNAEAGTLSLDNNQRLAFNADRYRLYFVSYFGKLVLAKEESFVKTFNDLSSMINEAQDMLSNAFLTYQGQIMLNEAISAAYNALYSGDVTAMADSQTNLQTVMAQVQETETITVSSWTIAGSSEEIFGTAWDTSNTANDMTEVEDGVFVLTKQKVKINSGTYYFKVVANHAWDVNFGANGQRDGENVPIYVEESGTYDFQFVFNRNEGNQLSYSYEEAASNFKPNPAVVVVHAQERDDLSDYESEIRENEGGTGEVWDNQFFIYANRPLKAGERTVIEFDHMATYEARTSTFCHIDPETYKHYNAIGDVWFYPGEEHYSTEFVVPEEADGMQTIAFNMAYLKEACDYTIKNIVWRLEDDSESLINLEGVENFYVKEGAGTIPHVYDPNAPQQSLVQETIYFNKYSGVYFDGTQTIDGVYGKVLFAQGEGNNQPYGNGSYIYFYAGNTMTLTSDLDILRVQFNSSYWIGDYGVNTGQITDGIWRGNTSEFTISNPLNYSTNRFYSITVTYQNLSPEALLARLTAQIEVTTTAIEGLTYAVPGKTELEALVTEASAATAETEKAQLKAYIQQLKEQTAAVVALDNQYKTLATLTAKVTTTAESNPFADATILAEATAFVQNVEAGLQACTYTAAQVDELIAKLNNYIEQLSLIYLTIHVADPGSLGDLVLEKGVEFADVAGLRVSGKLNTADQTTLKAFNNLQLVDLAETNLTTIANQQFSGKSTLKKVVLPNNTTTIGGNAFYNCYALEEIVVPATLQTIGEYAFYNCRALSAFYFPVGLTRIGYDAFYCNDSYYYDDDGNYVSVNGGSLKEISLPGTLVDYMGNAIGDYAFAGQKQLTKVTLAEGIDRISESVFRNCISLTDLTLPTTLTSIDSYAFAYCSALKILELPEGLAYINNNAFRDCSALEEVILPSTLQSIYRPFYNCPKLTKMTVKAIAAPDPQNNSIMGNSSASANVTLTVPNLSINVYKQAQYWNEFNIVGADIMPENITINTDYRLNWPEGLALEYRPNIYVASNASLWVNGNSVLSAGNFTLAYSYNNVYNNSNWNEDLQRYMYNRDNCFAALLNNAAYARANQVNIEAYTRANRWSFMSMPFDVKASDIALMFDETPYVIRKYDGAKRAEGKTGETWVNIGAEETIPAGQGFILQSASTDGNRNYNAFTFTAVNNEKKNDIFANDDVDVALAEYGAEFEHNRSWNLIGNPYPTYYDIRAMKTTVPITVWDDYNNNYQAYSPVDDAYILNPGQAFFMQRPINDGATVTFQKEGRQIDMEIRPLEDVANRAPMVEERSVFNLIVNGNEMSDRTRFVINNGAMMEYEAGRDANKFVSDEQSVQLYTIQNDVHFAINERPLGDAVIELGMIISKAGSYTIALNTMVENEVYLIDRLTGMEVRLDGTEGYVFDVEQGTIEGRFAIRLGGGDVTGIKSLERDNNAENYYDLQGRKIEMPAKGVYINNGKKVVVK